MDLSSFRPPLSHQTGIRKSGTFVRFVSPLNFSPFAFIWLFQRTDLEQKYFFSVPDPQNMDGEGNHLREFL